MAVTKSELKFYLTSAEPGVAQSDKNQSLGGYFSTTEIALSDVLTVPMTVSATTLPTASTFSGRVLVGDELVDVSSNVVNGRGSLATISKPHYTGIPVYAASSNSLFNNSFSADLKQYRCVALYNSNSTDSFVTLSVYFKFASRTANSAIRLGVETPATDKRLASATSGGTLYLIDSTLAGVRPDDYYTGCGVKFIGGSNINQIRRVISYDGATGTFSFNSLLPYAVTTDSYLVYPSPSQRITSGVVEPDVTWNAATSPVSCGTLGPNGVVYVWLERSETANVEEYLNNRVILTVSYKTA